jgi:hypothetical protein
MENEIVVYFVANETTSGHGCFDHIGESQATVLFPSEDPVYIVENCKENEFCLLIVRYLSLVFGYLSLVFGDVLGVLSIFGDFICDFMISYDFRVTSNL